MQLKIVFFTEIGGSPNGAVTFSNLDDSKYYSFEILSNRKTMQNREGQFTISGANTVVGFLNAGGTTNEGNTSNTLIIENIQPTGGSITIALENGPNNASNWSYMNCLKMVETTTASVNNLILANEGFRTYPNPVNNILNIDYVFNNTGKVKLTITDITGRIIHSENTGMNQAGTYSLKWVRNNVTSGVYFLQLVAENSNISKKLY